MTYEEMSKFTYEELSHFTHSQLEKDKFEIVQCISSHENDIPKETISKLYELCNDTITAYNEISNDSLQLVNKKNMELKDTIQCIGIIFSIFDKIISNDTITDFLCECFKRLVSIIDSILH